MSILSEDSLPESKVGQRGEERSLHTTTTFGVGDTKDNGECRPSRAKAGSTNKIGTNVNCKLAASKLLLVCRTTQPPHYYLAQDPE